MLRLLNYVAGGLYGRRHAVLTCTEEPARIRGVPAKDGAGLKTPCGPGGLKQPFVVALGLYLEISQCTMHVAMNTE